MTYPNSPKRLRSYPVGWCVVCRDDGRHGVIEQWWPGQTQGGRAGTSHKYQVRWRPTRRAPATLSMHGSAELRSATAREVAGLLSQLPSSNNNNDLEPSCLVKDDELG